MSRFKYQERSAETVSARAKQQGGTYDSYLDSRASFLKVKEGRNDLRILPPTWDMKVWGDNWGIEVYVHRDIGPDNNVYFCLDEMRKKYGNKAVPVALGDCPICEARREVEGDEERAKKLKPGKQILCYVINRDAEKDGPVVWRLGWQLERDIQLRSQEKSGAVIPIDHPDRGYDVSFNREGAGLKTKYLGVDIARDESPLHEKVSKQDGWLDFVQDNPLPELLIFHDADYISKVYSGKASPKDEEDDRRPSRSSRDDDDRGSKGRGRAAADDADEEPDTRTRARGRGDDADEEEDRSSRGRGRDDDDRDSRRGRDDDRRSSRDDDDRGGRTRSRGRDEPGEEDDRRGSRDRAPARERGRSRDDDDDRLPTDDEMRDNADRSRGGRDRSARDDDPPARARSSRAAAEDDDDKDPGDDADAEDTSDKGKGGKGKSTDRARASLERLKPKDKAR